MIEALVLQCAVADAPKDIIRDVIRVESLDDAMAVNINGQDGPDLPEAADLDALVVYVEAKIEDGHTADVGLMQVNSANFDRYDLDVRTAFDPCMNIAAGSEIFMRGYRAAVSFYGETEQAKRAALSAYNTGTFHRGFGNGYVERYQAESPAPLVGDRAEGADKETPQRSGMRINVTFGPDKAQE